MTSYLFYCTILQQTILQPTTIPAYSLTYGGAQALIGNRPRRQRKAPGAGTRTIGQGAGHEINLEIEDVLDKIKIK